MNEVADDAALGKEGAGSDTAARKTARVDEKCRVLIVAWKVKTGGGQVILRDYLTYLGARRDGNTYFVLVHDRRAYGSVDSSDVRVIQLPRFLNTSAGFMVAHLMAIRRVVRDLKVDVVFGFGGIPIHCSVPQLYLFQWPYAVYPRSKAWQRMDIASRLGKRARLWAFSRYIGGVTAVIAQTNTMKLRLGEEYGVRNVHVVPVAVSRAQNSDLNVGGFERPVGKVVFLCLTHYYPHKNLEIFVEVGRIIRSRGLPYVIVITIEEADHRGARRLLRTIAREKLGGTIVNIGRVRHEQVATLYRQSDAMVMPTLLETFGITYIEAMFHRRTILTSDLDFARDVCGEAAIYFDPMNAHSVVGAMERSCREDAEGAARDCESRRRLTRLWTREAVFDEYRRLAVGLVGWTGEGRSGNSVRGA